MFVVMLNCSTERMPNGDAHQTLGLAIKPSIKSLTPTEEQREIAAKLGLCIAADSFEVPSAKIQDTVAAWIGQPRQIPASTEQRTLARKMRINIQKDTMLVAFARIADAIFEKNTDAVERIALRNGYLV